MPQSQRREPHERPHFQITAGEPARPKNGDIAKLDAAELMKLHTHPNEWFSRQARLELIARANAGQNLAAVKDQLRALFDAQPEITTKLRAMWTLFGTGGTDDAFLKTQLRHPDEHVRAWAIRMLSDAWPLDTLMSARPNGGPKLPRADLDEFVRLAREEPSGLVRLALASMLQRLAIPDRVPLAEALVAHGEDAADHNLPLLIWYGLIPVGDRDAHSLVKIAHRCELPQTRRYIARRLAEDVEQQPEPLNDLLTFIVDKGSSEIAADILGGISEALAGWRKAPKPHEWDNFVSHAANLGNPELVDRVRDLAVVFGDGRALDEVKQLALDKTADLQPRQAALQTLIDSRAPDLREICEKLLGVQFLN
ncbi:MAG TPA: hypothetical protein VEO95_07800, partial [Chthoniobacteraceae bacterium]|nr:hypothetical protein [Chthoniobacteraceae bacterium]